MPSRKEANDRHLNIHSLLNNQSKVIRSMKVTQNVKGKHWDDQSWPKTNQEENVTDIKLTILNAYF